MMCSTADPFCRHRKEFPVGSRILHARAVAPALSAGATPQKQLRGSAPAGEAAGARRGRILGQLHPVVGLLLRSIRLSDLEVRLGREVEAGTADPYDEDDDCTQDDHLRLRWPLEWQSRLVPCLVPRR